MLAHFHKQGNIEAMEGYLDSCRRHWTDWMRGQVAPSGWEDRFSISRENWREKFLLYERDLAIQKDLEYLSEAVFVFYTKHLISSLERTTNSGEISAGERRTVMVTFWMHWS